MRLQCGHGPKTVENIEAMNDSLKDALLQCGHGPKTVENDWYYQDTDSLIVSASMRPRPEDRGEPATYGKVELEDLCFNAATARRPWRTQDAFLRCHRRPSPLQCGHGPKTVENLSILPAFRSYRDGASMRPRPEDRGEQPVHSPDCGQRERLQCGHGPKTVENSRCPGRHPDTGSSFNAATARRPWRTASAICIGVVPRLASMRPRPEDRGEPGPPCAARSGRPSFNAATARRPWRTRSSRTR